MNIIDAFELRTIDVQIDKKSTDMLPAHCFGDLATFRLDNFVRRTVGETPLSIRELWGIILLSNGCLFPSCPVFRSLDNAANFIYGTNLLCNSWARADREVYKRHQNALIGLMSQYNGYPLALLLPPNAEENSEEPGARMNLNGYGSDP